MERIRGVGPVPFTERFTGFAGYEAAQFGLWEAAHRLFSLAWVLQPRYQLKQGVDVRRKIQAADPNTVSCCEFRSRAGRREQRDYIEMYVKGLR
jgi:hypothetical protein